MVGNWIYSAYFSWYTIHICKFIFAPFIQLRHIAYKILHILYYTVPWLNCGISNHQQFDCLFRLTANRTSKIRITGPLWEESTSHWWIPLTKGQQFGTYFHVKASPCVEKFFPVIPIPYRIINVHSVPHHVKSLTSILIPPMSTITSYPA